MLAFETAQTSLACPASARWAPWPPAAVAEINFVVIGVILQMASVATESTRLTLVQILLQVGGEWCAGSSMGSFCCRLSA